MGTRTEILGRVPISRGKFNELATYYLKNIVLYANGSYMVNVPEITGVTPVDENGNLNPGWDVFNAVPVVQNPGDSEEAVMSQKAVTEAYGSLEDSPEYIEATVDADGKVIEGITVEGKKYLAKPTNQDEVLKKQIEGVEDQIAGNADALHLVDERLAAVEEKTEVLSHIDNPEYLEVTVDADDKIIEGITADGKKILGIPSSQDDLLQEQIDKTNLGIGENGSRLAEVEGKTEELSHIENPEYIDVTLDTEGKVIEGIYADGQKYLAKPSNQDEVLQNGIVTLQENLDMSVANINESLEDTQRQIDEKLESFPLESVDNPEFLDVTVDEDDKVIEGITVDGVKQVNISHSFNDKVIFNGEVELGEKGQNAVVDAVKNSDMEFGRSTDYKTPHLPKFGTTNIKQETFYLEYVDGISSIDDVTVRQDVEDNSTNAGNRMSTHHYYYGDKRLRFYASGKVKQIDGSYYAQDTIRKIYVDIDGVSTPKYYWADTLGMVNYGLGGYSGRYRVIEGYSVEISTEIYNNHLSELDALSNRGVLFIPSSSKEIPVVQIISTPCIGAWTVEDRDWAIVEGTDIGKKFGHDCIVDVDFENYLTLTSHKTEVKFQGNSTMGQRKHNLRYKFNKKQKIGEMIRTKSYNLKAAFADNCRFSENFIFRMLVEVWNHRPILNRYPWDGGVNGYYHGATGFIKGFLVTVSVGGEFYGIYTFGNKKDAKNYLLNDEDDASGIFVSGAGVSSNDWGHTLPYLINGYYDEELDASGTGLTSQETQDAIMTWTHFINNRLYLGSDDNEYNSTQLTDIDGTMYVTSTLDNGSAIESSVSATLIEFNRTNMDERLDVLGFIDYLICMQVFVTYDNSHNNIIIYSGHDKKKFHPFFYDVDNAIPYSSSIRTFDCNIFDSGIMNSSDLSFWNNLKSLCWDEIINRYYELRDNVLNIEYMKSTYKDISSDIPDEAYVNENSKWGSIAAKANFSGRLEYLEKRLVWLDENYFIK